MNLYFDQTFPGFIFVFSLFCHRENPVVGELLSRFSLKNREHMASHMYMHVLQIVSGNVINNISEHFISNSKIKTCGDSDCMKPEFTTIRIMRVCVCVCRTSQEEVTSLTTSFWK